MSAITAKASRKMKKYAVLTREPRCFLGSFDFSWEQRKFSDVVATRRGLTYKPSDIRKNGVRVLRSSNIAEDSFVLSDEDVFVVREAVNIDCVRANDILITAANGSSRLVGKHTIISGIPEESAVHGGFMLLGTTKEPHFVNASMGSSWYRRFIELFVAGGNGAIGNLNKNDLDNQDIAIPSEKEQKKIGSFFRQLDNLITLHQRKCVFLFGFFQAFISMIFTASTFSWEQRKFSDVVATRRGLTYKPSDIRKNGVRVLRSSNIAEDSFVLSDEDVFVVREAVNIDCVRANDILITAANGSSRLVGKHTIISGIPEESAVHGGFMLLGTTKEPHFVNASMGSSWYRRFIELFVAGGNGAIGNLNKNDLDNQDIAIPSEKEQKKIGSFFRQLDNLITLHQRECISFTARAGRRILTANKKRNTSSWEQRKVGDLLIERNQQAPMSDEYPLMAFIANEGVAPKGERYDRSALVTDTVNKLYKKTEKGDFIYSSNNLETGSIGLNKYGKACISPVYSIFEPTGIADSDFLGRRLVRKDFINAMVKWRQGVIYGQWRIHESDFLKIEITVPSVEEQRKIGAYLDQLDNLITLHQRKPFLMKWRTSDANRNKTNRLVL